MDKWSGFWCVHCCEDGELHIDDVKQANFVYNGMSVCGDHWQNLKDFEQHERNALKNVYSKIWDRKDIE